MYDEEYEKLKGKFTLDKYKIENYVWNVGFLTNIKDKNNRQSFILMRAGKPTSLMSGMKASS